MNTITTTNMTTNYFYFSFMGYAVARKISYSPSSFNLSPIHEISGGDWEATLYKTSTGTNLQYLCKRRFHPEEVWYQGNEVSTVIPAHWSESWYAIKRDSWRIEPACPVGQYRLDMETAFILDGEAVVMY